MTKFLLCLLCLLCGALRAAEEPRVYFKQDANGVWCIDTRNPAFAALQDKAVALLTSDERNELRKYFLAQLNAADYTNHVFGAGGLMALGEVGDEESIKLVVEAYHAGNRSAGDALEQAFMLPYLMDDAYNGSTEWHHTDDVVIASIRHKSTEMAFYAIMNEEKFPAEIRAWAKQAEALYDGLTAKKRPRARRSSKPGGSTTRPPSSPRTTPRPHGCRPPTSAKPHPNQKSPPPSRPHPCRPPPPPPSNGPYSPPRPSPRSRSAGVSCAASPPADGSEPALSRAPRPG